MSAFRATTDPRLPRPYLPTPPQHIFENSELLGPDRAAGVELAGGDSDLGAEAELAAAGELGGGVPDHDRAVDAVEEGGGGFVGGDERFGMAGAEAGDAR